MTHAYRGVPGSVSESTRVGSTDRAQAHTGLPVSAKAKATPPSETPSTSRALTERGRPSRLAQHQGTKGTTSQSQYVHEAQRPESPHGPQWAISPTGLLPPNVQGRTGVGQVARCCALVNSSVSDLYPWLPPRDIQALPVAHQLSHPLGLALRLPWDALRELSGLRTLQGGLGHPCPQNSMTYKASALKYVPT